MPEEDAFCVFVKMLENYKLREVYKPLMAELGVCLYQLEKLIEVWCVYVCVTVHIQYIELTCVTLYVCISSQLFLPLQCRACESIVVL